jgi:hypothetical protein
VRGRPCHEKKVTVAWGVVLTLVTKCLSISLILGIQGDPRREWLRAKLTDANGGRDAEFLFGF